MPPDFLEVHGVDVDAGRQQFVEPLLETKEAHAAAFEAMRLEVLGAAGDGVVQLVQCPPGMRAQVKGQNCRVHVHLQCRVGSE